MLRAAVHESPDSHGTGLTTTKLDPFRYGGQKADRFESPGILNRFMPARVRVLDVGCGVGSVTRIANANKANEVVGIEPDPERAACARTEGLDVTCGLLDSDFFAQRGSFDVVVFADVLEHVANPAELLRLALAGLRPGGKILISVPNVAHWTVRFHLLFGRFDYTDTGIFDATHLRWFTKKTLLGMLESCGLEAEQIRHSAGTFVKEYRKFPWKLLPPFLRYRLIRACVLAFPLLFGCQHVVMARRKGQG